MKPDYLQNELKYAKQSVAHLKKGILASRLLYLFYFAVILMQASFIYYGYGSQLTSGICIGCILGCWFFTVTMGGMNLSDYDVAKKHLGVLESFVTSERETEWKRERERQEKIDKIAEERIKYALCKNHEFTHGWDCDTDQYWIGCSRCAFFQRATKQQIDLLTQKENICQSS